MLQNLSHAWDNSYKLLVGGVAALTIAGGSVAAVNQVQQYNHDHHVSQGTVIGKEYDDPDTWVTTICSGTPMHCTPIVNHDGEHWKLRLKGTDRIGESREVWHEVDKPVFNQAENGMDFNLDNNSWIDR